MTDILIGAASWQVNEWLTSFYPEDLPPEWQLSYYANEFSTALLESQLWNNPEQLEQLAEMLEDCHEGFHPVLSVEEGKVTPQQVSGFFQWLDKLDVDIGTRRVAGVLLSVEGEVFERSALQEWLECIPEVVPVALYGYDGFDGANGHWLAAHRMSPVWLASQPVVKNIEYWLCDLSLTDDKRELAKQVGGFLAGIPGNRSVCLIAGSGYEDIARLMELSTIVRLING